MHSYPGLYCRNKHLIQQYELFGKSFMAIVRRTDYLRNVLRCRAFGMLHHYRNSVRSTALAPRLPCTLPLRETGDQFPFLRLPAGLLQCALDTFRLVGDCSGAPCVCRTMRNHHHRYPVCKAALQAHTPQPHAFRHEHRFRLSLSKSILLARPMLHLKSTKMMIFLLIDYFFSKRCKYSTVLFAR